MSQCRDAPGSTARRSPHSPACIRRCVGACGDGRKRDACRFGTLADEVHRDAVPDRIDMIEPRRGRAALCGSNCGAGAHADGQNRRDGAAVRRWVWRRFKTRILSSDRSSRRRRMKVLHKPRLLLVCQRRSAPCMSIMFALIYECSTMMAADHKPLV
jgi:hypothetical protein